jgi:hypothetical protein
MTKLRTKLFLINCIKPNSTLLGYRLRLNLYNLANLIRTLPIKLNLQIIQNLEENQNGCLKSK